MQTETVSDPAARLERAGRELAALWREPPPGTRRIDLLHAFALGADFEVYFDSHGQAVIHTGFFLQHGGEVASLAAPCVERR